MAKDKPEELSRRNFIGLALGSALVAGIGCGNDSSPGQSGAGGTGSASGGNPGTDTKETEPTEGGSSSTTKTGKGGSTASTTGKNTSSSGGNTSSESSTAGGANPSGGSSSSSKSSGNGGSSSGSSSKSSGNGGSSSTATGGNTSAQGGTTGSGETPYVAMIRDSDAIAATMAAIAAAGGFPDLTGKVVFIKANLIDPAPPGCVSPDVIRGIIRAVKKNGTPSEIYVGDDAFTGKLSSVAGDSGNKMASAVAAEGATLQDLDGADTSPSLPSGATASSWGSGIPVYKALLDADYVINAAVCKTHGVTNFSMALKNWYGAQSNTSHSHQQFALMCNIMSEIHLALREDFVVLDATKCLLKGGPNVGSSPTASPGIVIATTDPIAADVTGLCILKHYLQTTGTANTKISGTSVWDQQMIKYALTLTGLKWLTSKQNFTYSAVGIDEAATIMGYRD